LGKNPALRMLLAPGSQNAIWRRSKN
jgi:hypothetical protein